MGRVKIFLVFFTLIGCPILTFASCAKNSDQEAINSELKQEINRLWAINEIQNLMGTYAFLQTSGMNFFAAERLFTTYDDTVIEMMWGRFIGKDAAYRAYTVGHRAYDQPTITALNIDIPAVDTSVPGASAGDVAPDPAGADNNIITSPEGLIKSGGASLHIHTLTTPVIQVARDGQTARAVWMCPGLEGTTLTWIKYGCDFKIQDGRWKIWHLHVYGILTGEPKDSFTPNTQPRNGADKPPTTNWDYSNSATHIPLEPAPPEPYETWGKDMVPITYGSIE
jgi:hypothetical protein